MGDLSGLSRIKLTSSDPLDLFAEWSAEAKQFSGKKFDVICLSTVSENGGPRGRNVILLNFDAGGFYFSTDGRGQKAQELAANHRAAMTIYWTYQNADKELICRQIRIEGVVELLPRNEVAKIYETEETYAKIRTHLCHQDVEVVWEDLKKRHDELLEEVKVDSSVLKMPNHFVGYRLVPTWMDFYLSQNKNFIADRIQFEKNQDGTWINKRVAA